MELCSAVQANREEREREIKKKNPSPSVFLTVGIIASRVSHYYDGAVDAALEISQSFLLLRKFQAGKDRAGAERSRLHQQNVR